MIENIDPTSRHKIGDKIILNFFNCGKLMFGNIAGVKYIDYGKVLYDITLYPFKHEEGNENIKTTLKDVDSYFIKKIQEHFECN